MNLKKLFGIALCLLMSQVAFADKFPSSLSTSEQLFWGVFDTMHPSQSSIIISDTAMAYDSFTKFKSLSGSLIDHPENNIDPGTPVKYHVLVLPGSFKLIDVQVISDEEYKTLNKQLID